MSRFLDLCESLDPNNAENIHAAWEAKNILNDHHVPVNSKGNDIYLHLNTGGVKKLIHLKVVGLVDPPKISHPEEMVPEEEAESPIASSAALDTAMNVKAKVDPKSKEAILQKARDIAIRKQLPVYAANTKKIASLKPPEFDA